MMIEYLMTFFLCITVILSYFGIIMFCMDELVIGFILLIVCIITGAITTFLANMSI